MANAPFQRRHGLRWKIENYFLCGSLGSICSSFSKGKIRVYHDDFWGNLKATNRSALLRYLDEEDFIYTNEPCAIHLATCSVREYFGTVIDLCNAVTPRFQNSNRNRMHTQ
jgi:hypothetical protein